MKMYIDQFIDACIKYNNLDFKKFFPVPSRDELSQKLKAKIKNCKILIDAQNYRFPNLIIKFYNCLLNEYKIDHNGLMPEDIALLENDQFLKALLDISPTQSKQKRFILCTLSDRFRKDITTLRQRYNLPVEGFGNDGARYRAWYKQKQKQRDKLEEDLDRLFSSKYKIRKFAVSYWYLVGGLLHMSVIEWLSQPEPYSPIETLTSDQIEDFKKSNQRSKSKQSIPYVAGLDDLFMIVINEPMDIKTITKYLKKSWRNSKTRDSEPWIGIKDRMNTFFNRVAENNDFQKDYIIYYLHQVKKFKHTKIRKYLGYAKKIKADEISEKAIGATIKRLNERIADLEKATQS